MDIERDEVLLEAGAWAFLIVVAALGVGTLMLAAGLTKLGVAGWRLSCEMANRGGSAELNLLLSSAAAGGAPASMHHEAAVDIQRLAAHVVAGR